MGEERDSCVRGSHGGKGHDYMITIRFETITPKQEQLGLYQFVYIQ